MSFFQNADFLLRKMGEQSKCFACLTVMVLTGCAETPGPSVPSQPGKNLASAKVALASCQGVAQKGGRGAVTGSYVAGVLLGGVVVGPIIVASNQKNIRSNGEVRAVDRCLGEQGYVRRDLTAQEVQALNTSDAYQRELILDHLIGGGTLDGLGRGKYTS